MVDHCALSDLLDVAEVHILSYVASPDREWKVHRQICQLIPTLVDRVKAVHIYWQKTGRDGKCAGSLGLLGLLIFFGGWLPMLEVALRVLLSDCPLGAPTRVLETPLYFSRF